MVVLVNLFISFAVGCATRASRFKNVRSSAPLICIVSQFGLQPLLVSSLCLWFEVPKYPAIGLILCSCTPGGNGSNLAEVIFGGVRSDEERRTEGWREGTARTMILTDLLLASFVTFLLVASLLPPFFAPGPALCFAHRRTSSWGFFAPASPQWLLLSSFRFATNCIVFPSLTTKKKPRPLGQPS